jgi:SAM-dependent methyltransferase
MEITNAMSERPYLDYYTHHGIIPVRQDIRDLEKHFRRREGLYRHLGILPASVRRQRVIEFGPGTGDNAVYTASLEPELYVFVDANPFAVAHLRSKAADGLLGANCIEYAECDVREFADSRSFDLVLCEGIVHAQRDPAGFLKHMAGVTAPGGIVVATTHSAISMFPEMCRRLMRPLFARDTPKRDELLPRLVRFFAPDLTYLPGMSRLPEDWVQDNILQPWPDAEQLVFTIEDAILALDDDFDLLGTSPRFIQDWRWYKSIPEDKHTLNEHAMAEAKRWSLAFLDHRVDPFALRDFEVIGLEEACRHAIALSNAAWRSGIEDDIRGFLVQAQKIQTSLSTAMPRTAASIADYVNGIESILAGRNEAEFGDFRSLFGRTQQYVSFTRRAEPADHKATR